MTNKKIGIVVGSFRKGSFNKTLADYIFETLENKGIEAEFVEYRNVPILEQDTEYPTPKEMSDIRNQVSKLDGLWIVSPEYNGSYPALLKNLLDWLSRPAKQFDFETPTVINSLPTTVSGAAGSTKAKFVRAQILGLLAYIRTNVMPGDGVGLQIPQEAWQTGEFILSDEQKEEINNQVNEFINFINK
ncbi:NAD(P)H-dependent oxidoreductase [Gemella sp. GH3]|uniref:NADPH-dependent FMN reductase n=1 Tax=unclassified Gemella TaxID=2624949 RepID=UPI0015D05C8E|nr:MULTISPECIES: NADPH-dependent FMN reductase [unclassified Gemella]MBF0713352.1 NAD(P)H-dependent oxidoreductase [Gemella sp. GH3.1]NYS50304.1 NAD(P)H-dependent oxidoreductase [Gemella sp. GH3]